MKKRGKPDAADQGYCASVAGYGFSARLRTTRKDLLNAALLGLPSGFRTIRNQVDGPDFRVAARDGVFEFLEGDQIAFRGRSKRALRLAIEAVFELKASTLSDEFAFLHAGGVVLNGRAILLPGRSHAGKSSLVEAFLRRGASYLSDDMIPIDRKLRAHPFPRAIGRRAAPGMPPLKISLRSLGARVALRPAPIDVMWCGLYEPAISRATFQVHTGRAAFAQLLPHAPGARSRPDVAIPILTRLATNASVFSGVRGDADQAAEAVIALLDSRRRKVSHSTE